MSLFLRLQPRCLAAIKMGPKCRTLLRQMPQKLSLALIYVTSGKNSTTGSALATDSNAVSLKIASLPKFVAPLWAALDPVQGDSLLCVADTVSAIAVGVSSTSCARLDLAVDAPALIAILLWDVASLVGHVAPQPVRAHKIGRLRSKGQCSTIASALLM